MSFFQTYSVMHDELYLHYISIDIYLIYFYKIEIHYRWKMQRSPSLGLTVVCDLSFKAALEEFVKP